jgi:O-antigen ligase
LVVVVIAVLFLAGGLQGRRISAVSWRIPLFAILILCIVVLWMVTQTVPGVPVPLRHPIWSALGSEVDASRAAISINPAATWAMVAQVVPACLLALFAMTVAFDPRRARTLLRVVVAATVLVAIWGLGARYLGIFQVPLLSEDAYPGFLTGTFVNRNSAATYFVIGIAVAAALLAARLEDVVVQTRGQNWFFGVAHLMQRAGLYLAAGVILCVALLNTGSRGGIFAGGIALLIVTVSTVRRTRLTQGSAPALFIAIFALLFSVAAVSSDVFLARLQTGITGEDRFAVFRDTLDMIAARPWLGHGAGAFADAFPLYHQRASADVWTHAHNSYLQAIAELGIPAFALLVIPVITVALRLIRGAEIRTQRMPATVAALAALGACAAHALVDFSIQIEAVGLTLAVLVGGGLGETLATQARELQPGGEGRRARPMQRETRHVVIPLALGSGETVGP